MAAEALEKSALESKDKDQLMAIAAALGVKTSGRASKAILVEKILEKTGVPEATPKPKPARTEKPARAEKAERDDDQDDDETQSDTPRRGKASAQSEPTVYLGADGEPLAEWEIELAQHEGRLGELQTASPGGSGRNDRGDRSDRGPRQGGQNQQRQGQGQQNQQRQGDWEEGRGNRNNRNRRRRGRNGRDEGPQGDDRYEGPEGISEPVSNDPVQVEGYLDLRDEGYGFLRIGGYKPRYATSVASQQYFKL